MDDDEYVAFVETCLSQPQQQQNNILLRMIHESGFKFSSGAKFRNLAHQKLVQSLQDPEFDLKLAKLSEAELVGDLEAFGESLNVIENNLIVRGKNCYLRPVAFEEYCSRLEHLIYETSDLFNQSQANEQYLNFILLFSGAFKLNKQLRQRILFNNPPPECLIRYKNADLECGELRTKREAAKEAINAGKDLARFVMKTSIECKKCHQLTVVTDQKQSRSADEAMTQNFICTACGFKWSKN